MESLRGQWYEQLYNRGTLMSSLKGMRDANEAPTGHTKRGTQNSSPIEVPDQPGKHKKSLIPAGELIFQMEYSLDVSPKDCKQVLDTVQRLACIGLAIWDFIT